ncbi:MAG: hypothetical protein IV100_15615 [Myxococcales bacterium]|nr:hypothetical protein [Myxococcales bacterium]
MNVRGAGWLARVFGPRGERVWLPLLSISLLLVMGEVVCRVFGLADDLDHDFRFFIRNVDGDVEETFNQEDALLMWAPRPGYSAGQLRIDDAGFRVGGERGATSDDALRVALLGDSTTFGIDVPFEATFGARLGARSGGRLQILNAGVTGYTSTQALARYRRDVRPWKPDVVVLQAGINDPVARFWLSDDQIMEERIPGPIAALLNRWLLRSHFFRVIRSATLALLGRPSAPGPDVPRVGSERLADNVRALAEDVVSDGGRLVLLVSPVSPAAAGWPRLAEVQRYRAILAAEARAVGAVVVEVSELMEATGDSALFLDTVHPNARGHDRLAAALLPVLTP